MENLIEICIAVLCSTGFWTFCMHMYDKHSDNRISNNEMKRKLDKVDDMDKELHDYGNCTIAVTRAELNRYCNQYLTQGYIPLTDVEAFTEMGKAYMDAGGNAEVKYKFNKCIELPTK